MFSVSFKFMVVIMISAGCKLLLPLLRCSSRWCESILTIQERLFFLHSEIGLSPFRLIRILEYTFKSVVQTRR